MVVFLGNGILGGKPQILPGIQRIIKAAPGKAFDRTYQVMLPLDNARPGKFMDQLPGLCTILRRIHQLTFAGARDLHLACLVHIPIGMAGNRNRLLPVPDARLDALDRNRGAEYGAVKNRADGTVGAFPHLFEIIFRHTGSVGGNGSAFDGHAILLGGLRRVKSYLVIRLIAVLQAQIVIFCLQIHKRQNQLILNHFPKNAGHLIPIHLHQRSCHFNFFHRPVLLYCKASCIVCNPESCSHGCSVPLWHYRTTISNHIQKWAFLSSKLPFLLDFSRKTFYCITKIIQSYTTETHKETR